MIKRSLRQLRYNADLTQKQAAEKLEVSMDTIRRWEQGWTYPTAPEIVKICTLYNTNFDNIEFEPVKKGKAE